MAPSRPSVIEVPVDRGGVAQFVVDEVFRGDHQLVGEPLDVRVTLESSCAVQDIEEGAEYVIFTDAEDPSLYACTPAMRLGVGDAYHHCADPTDDWIEILDHPYCAEGEVFAKMSEEALLAALREAPQPSR